MPSVLSCTLDRYHNPHDIDERNRGTSQLRYHVVTDGAMAPNAVVNAALSVGPNPLPSLWSTYSYLGHNILTIYARHYHADYKYTGESGLHYDVTVDYGPLDPGHNPGYANVDPLTRPPVLHWTSEVDTVYSFFDINGQLITNYAGIRYEDPVERQVSRGVLVVEINVPNLAQVIAHNRTHESTVNAVNWDLLGDGSVIFGQRQALCRAVQSQRQVTEGGTVYFTEIYHIVFEKPDRTWDERIAERGLLYTQRDAQGQLIMETIPGPGNQMTPKLFPPGGLPEPVKLNEDGTWRPKSEPGLFRDWQVWPTSDFNSMPFMPL